MNGKGIVVAGVLILDRHYAIASYPEEGRLVRINGTHEDVGGTGNIIIDLAKIDSQLNVAVSAILGTGSNGRNVKRELEKYPNINTDGIVYEGHTPVTIVMDADDTRQRTFFYSPGASDRYCEKYIQWDKLDGSIFQLEYLLVMKGIDAPDSEYGTHAARILAKAQKRGMKTSIDIVSEKSARVAPIVRAALKYTDYCIINELEAEAVTEIPLQKDGKIIKENRRAVLEKLVDFGASTWVIVHAGAGSFGLDVQTGNAYAVSSLPLPDGYIKGKTGAGDAYCCGVLYSAYKGKSIVEAMELGTACASCSLSALNGTDGMRDYNGVLALFDMYKSGVKYEEI